MRVFPLTLIVLALLLATASTILFITTRTDKLRLESSLAASEATAAQLNDEAARKRSLYAEMAQQFAQYEDTKAKLAASEKQRAELQDSLAQTKNLLMVREQNEGLLNEEIARMRSSLAKAQLLEQELSQAKNRVDELEKVLALLHQRGISTEAAQSAATASVLGVGPDNAFIIINLGSKHGLRAGQKLYVRRGTEIIGNVLTSEVLDEVSVAQVDPAALRTALRKGDSVILDQ